MTLNYAAIFAHEGCGHHAARSLLSPCDLLWLRKDNGAVRENQSVKLSIKTVWCYSFDLDYPPKVHVRKVWSPA